MLAKGQMSKEDRAINAKNSIISAYGFDQPFTEFVAKEFIRHTRIPPLVPTAGNIKKIFSYMIDKKHLITLDHGVYMIRSEKTTAEHKDTALLKLKAKDIISVVPSEILLGIDREIHAPTQSNDDTSPPPSEKTCSVQLTIKGEEFSFEVIKQGDISTVRGVLDKAFSLVDQMDA